MINLQDVLRASNGQLFGSPAGHLFTGFSLDLRHVKPRAMFVATRTDYGDTHQDMRAAIQAGATGLLCNTPPDFDTEGTSVIVVKDTEQALMGWGGDVLANATARPIIVAGTSGHATTIDAVQRVLSVRYQVHSQVERTHPGRLNIPLSLADLDDSHDFVLLDVRADTPGELAQAVNIIQPHGTVVTHIGQAYMNRFESVGSIVKEHEITMTGLPDDGVAVLNYNEDAVRPLGSLAPCRVLTVGIDDYGSDLQAYKLVIGPTGTGFDLRHGEQRFVGRWTPLLGRNQLHSVLAALALGLHYDIPLEQGLRALTQQEPLPGHMNTLIGAKGCIVVDDTHDATPESTLDALAWLAEIKARDPDSRVIFVFGDMDNLGDASRAAHRRVGQRAAEAADMILTEGAQAAITGRAAQDTSTHPKPVFITNSIRDATDTLLHEINLGDHDILLVKGGVSARMELIVKALLPDADDHQYLVRQTNVAGLEISERPLRPSWVEIDREALANNVRLIRAAIAPDVALMATVKADAYGHGAVTVSRIALRNGANYLAVASVAEALEIRNAGINAPILVLSYTPVHAIRDLIRNDITITLYDLNLARAYHKVAQELQGTLKVHVKLDTGMGRLGILPEDAVTLFRHLIHMPHLDLEGAYTHFSVADEDTEFTQYQAKLFKDTLMPIRAAGIKLKYMHAANSAGTLLDEDFHFSMARTGLLLYGYHPSSTVPHIGGLQPLMTWKTVIAQVKTLPAGHAIGYGNTYITDRTERVATIPVGYGDGFRRSPNWGEVLVHGQRAPIRGRVSMEKTVISVDHLDGVGVGDEVVLLGSQGEASITADEIAARLGTINYEVLTGVLPRVPRS